MYLDDEKLCLKISDVVKVGKNEKKWELFKNSNSILDNNNYLFSYNLAEMIKEYNSIINKEDLNFLTLIDAFIKNDHLANKIFDKINYKYLNKYQTKNIIVSFENKVLRGQINNFIEKFKNKYNVNFQVVS